MFDMLHYDVTTGAAADLDTLPGLSTKAEREMRWLVDERRREDERAGRRMLSEGQDFSVRDLDELVDEAIELKDGFTILAEIAARPDADTTELVSVYDDLVRRTRFLRVRAEQWQERVETHNEEIGDPAGAWEAFTKKWADISGHPEQYLHAWPW